MIFSQSVIIGLLLLALTLPVRAQFRTPRAPQPQRTQLEDSPAMMQLKRAPLINTSAMPGFSVENPFPDAPKLHYPFLYRLFASVVWQQANNEFIHPQGEPDISINGPDIHNENFTEYELATERLTQYPINN